MTSLQLDVATAADSRHGVVIDLEPAHIFLLVNPAVESSGVLPGQDSAVPVLMTNPVDSAVGHHGDIKPESQ